MGAVADADNGCLENAADVNRACVLDMTLGTRTRQNGTHKGDRKAHPPTKPRKGFCVLGSPARDPFCPSRAGCVCGRFHLGRFSKYILLK